MSFFKAPSWAKAQTTDDSDDEDLFSHSKDFMEIQRDRLEQERMKKERVKRREEERERKREEKAAQKASKAGVKRESLDADSKEEPVKKRRINSEESARLLASVGIKPVTIDSDDEDEQIQYDVEDAAPVRRSPRTQRTRDVYSNSRSASALSGAARADDDSESEVEVLKASVKPAPVVEIEEEEDSDPEIAAVQRRAREKHRLKKQQEQRSSTPGAAQSDAEVHSGLPTPPPPDPIISLLITSELEGTNQLLVKRKLTQDLGTARRAWCQKQGFDQDFSDQVFFTWNGRRMYDSTTCQRLGLEVDATGNVIRTDQRDADGAAQVLVIATTQEQLHLEKAEQVRQAKLVTAQYEPEEETASAAEEEPAKVPIKIVVQAKNQQPVRITVFSVSTKRPPRPQAES